MLRSQDLSGPASDLSSGVVMALLARRTIRSVLPAAAVAAALLLTACGGGSDSGAAGLPQGGPPLPGGPVVPGGVPAAADPASTFALDVDTASFDYARRLIGEGQLPDPKTVRVEEFINAFRQDYPQPAGNGFTVTVDGAAGGLGVPTGYGADAEYQPGGAEVRLMRVGLQTRAADPAGSGTDSATGGPVALTFVVDVSGSMSEPGRLDLVQHALHTLVDQLGAEDSFALVAYSSSAAVLWQMTSVAAERSALHAAIDRLHPLQNTNLAAGLAAGYQVARAGFVPGAENRVILLSDGLANAGATDPVEILDQVRNEASRGIDLLCVGVGREYGDELMERLADQGDGMAVYVSSVEDARALFVDRLASTLQVRARDAKAQVVFDPQTVLSYRLIGYDNRLLADTDFRNDEVDGAEIGPGHSVTALYEIVLAPGAAPSGRVAQASVRWLDPVTELPDEATREVFVADLAGDVWREPSARLQVDAVVARFAALLRVGADGWSGYQAGPYPLSDATELAGHADRLAAMTEDPQVAELAELLRRAGHLIG